MKSFDVTPHLEPMRRYARVLTRAETEADDLVQGALLKAYERRGSFRAGADLRVWLMNRANTRFTLPSKMGKGKLKAELRMPPAVVRPMPGRAIASARVRGNCPPCRSITNWAARCRLRARL